MGKASKKERKAIANWNCFEELRRLGKETGVAPLMLNSFPMHIRLFGIRQVDYWPSTERAWVHGEDRSHKPVSPAGVLMLAQTAAVETLPDGAAEHIADL